MTFGLFLGETVVVLIANSIPPAVRGKLKLWFLEPRANVFVSLVGGRVLDAILSQITPLFPPEAGLLVLRGNARTMIIRGIMDTGLEVFENCGVPLLKSTK